MATPDLTGQKPFANVPADARMLSRRRLGADVVAIVAGVVLTLVLVLPHYVRRPFWFDELVSLESAGLRPQALLDYVFTVEANMAVYHAVLSPWLTVGGDEATVRGLSIAFALATLPFLYALAVRLFDRRTAVFAVLLMSVNVSYVGFARDARSYALTLLLVTAASFFLILAVEGSRTRDWGLYVATAVLAVWAHLFAVLVVVAQVAWLLLHRRVIPRRQALAAVAIVGGLILPLVVAITMSGQGGQLDWVPRPGFRKLPGLLQWFVESRLTLAVYFAGALSALVGARAEWRRDGTSRPQRYVLLLAWLVLPVAVAFALSFATPVYLYRYFLVCLPALVLLVSAGFARIRPAWLGIVLAAAALALSIRTVESCQPDCKIRHDDWEAAAAYIEAQSRPGDAIVFYPDEVRTPLAHYLGPKRPRLLFPARWGLIGGAAEGTASLGAAMREADRHRRVWLITWWLPSEPAHEALSRMATLVDAREFQGNVHVELYRPGSSG